MALKKESKVYLSKYCIGRDGVVGKLSEAKIAYIAASQVSHCFRINLKCVSGGEAVWQGSNVAT
jgi:hypothetical protein